MSTAVREILDQILRLPQEERAEFESELARLEEAEWIAMASDARRWPEIRGIDDVAIARAVESLRFGHAAACHAV
jgi:hypothetical protein